MNHSKGSAILTTYRDTIRGHDDRVTVLAGDFIRVLDIFREFVQNERDSPAIQHVTEAKAHLLYGDADAAVGMLGEVQIHPDQVRVDTVVEFGVERGARCVVFIEVDS